MIAILHFVFLAVVFGAGFGIGRVKNAKKLAAVKGVIARVESFVTKDVNTVISLIKAKL